MLLALLFVIGFFLGFVLARSFYLGRLDSPLENLIWVMIVPILIALPLFERLSIWWDKVRSKKV